MKIRRFEGNSTQEALLLAQQALGADAVVLQTRRVKAPGITGLLGTSRVEVLAAVDPAAAPRHSALGIGHWEKPTQPPPPNAQRLTPNAQRPSPASSRIFSPSAWKSRS